MAEHPIYIIESECRGCCKCVECCPVKAVKVWNGRVSVSSTMCILCGTCLRVCPASARKTRDDTKVVKKLLRQKKKTFVSLAPSFASEFSDCTPGQLTAALKRMGFFAVSETALGADYVSAGIAAALKKVPSGGFHARSSERKGQLVYAADSGAVGGQKLFLSSACPAVVLYLKRYAAAFVPYLNDRASPLLAHAQFLRSLYGERINIVFIGPCIAKKREADQFREISAAITFDELRRWFRDEDIDPLAMSETRDDEFIPCRAAKGAFYPIDGGMIVSMRKYKGFSKTVNMVISGINVIMEMLNAEARIDSLESPLFLELLACQGGCVNGPCVTRDASAISRRARLLRYAESASDALDMEMSSRPLSLNGELTAAVIRRVCHTPDEIRAVLKQTGKYGVGDEINCSKCGYKSCRDFAAAMLEKRAEKAMCALYTRHLARRKANGLMNAMPGGVVIVEKNMRVIECNKNFASLMGSEIEELYKITARLAGFNLNKIPEIALHFEEVFSAEADGSFDYDIRVNIPNPPSSRILHLNVFVIEKGETAAGVFTDVTVPRIRWDRTISKAKTVIEKNVRTAQKIAFLLGENVAETETLLNSMIASRNTGMRKK
ncbi:MAG: 4Fe-4S binding protein [Spirochaetaceae bacterium]|nr:4Fe-4S binding protein [Spirochaetaceae bacterium]